MARLYLIPNLLGDTPWQEVLPPTLPGILASLGHFIVEDSRNARRFLKKLDPGTAIDQLTFYELNENSGREERERLDRLFESGEDAGLISEAGCPAVADPGAMAVRMAHRKNYRIIPLAGPSSILLALMASGLNGQSFAFAGYLPVKQQARIRKIKELEKAMLRLGQSQIFIETPYRNNPLLKDLLSGCHPSTCLCIASNLTTGQEQIRTRTIAEWKENIPELDKQPSIFILGIAADLP